jgi:hypothetical protein
MRTHQRPFVGLALLTVSVRPHHLETNEEIVEPAKFYFGTGI